MTSAKRYYERGKAHSAKGDFARTVEDFTKAIEFDPDFIESYTERGFNRIRAGDYDGAISEYNWALEHDIQNKARDYCDLSDAYRLKGDFDRALKKCNKAIELNPIYNYSYQIRGRIYCDLHQYEQAIEDFSEAIDRFACEIYLQKVISYEWRGRFTVSWEMKSVPMPILPRQKHSKMQRAKAKDVINEYGDSNYRTFFLDEKRFELMAVRPDWLLGPESDPFGGFGASCHQCLPNIP